MQSQNLILRPLRGWDPGPRPVEVVERKGLGHPDTLCDAISERISAGLCHEYQRRFEMTLHHNVDKVLLCGGASRAAFGGGDIVEPLEFYLAGRATRAWRGERVEVDEIAVEACKEVLRETLPELDLQRHVRIVPRIREGSTDLRRLFERGSGIALANDTSCGVGFAPATDLERVVLRVEHCLNSSETHRSYPAVGSDIKIMGVRRDNRITLTVGCAMIGRHLRDVDEYAGLKQTLCALATNAAGEVTMLDVEAHLNVADDLSAGDLFLTVTGTSAEAGDDGETGRGNRVGGLITPYRPMTMEAAAGKNPVSHVGKLYNIVAGRICAVLVAKTRNVLSSTCRIVSRIGARVDEPQLVDVELGLGHGVEVHELHEDVEGVVNAQLERIPELRRELLEQRINVF
jgi:S-adenosylmethionine synthetase